MKPVIFGYLNVRIDAPPDTMSRGERVLKEYAWREGYSLGTVFVERNVSRPLAALASLIAASNREDVRVVAVPTAADLGSLPRVRLLTSQLLQREADVRVIIIGTRR